MTVGYGEGEGTIAVFGGSFDPFTRAHLEAIRHVLEGGERVDRVVVVPAYRHPLKVPVAPWEARLEMARAAVEDLPADLRGRVEVSDLEAHLGRGGLDETAPVYTLDLLRTLAADRPGAHLALVVGPDIPAEASRWRGWDEIRRDFRIVILPDLGPRATEVRRALSRGRPWRPLVPPAVAGVIDRRGLYRSSAEEL